MLIPTTYKENLERGFSYPVGAQAISEELVEAPQFDKLSLWFSQSPELFKSTFRKVMESGRPFPVIVASFRKTDVGISSAQYMIDSGWYDADWSIHVYSVPSGKRRAVKQLILDVGLKQIEEWLSLQRTETWFHGRKSVSVMFDPLNDCLELGTEEEEP